MAKPPNIVLVLADDMGYGDLGCQNDSSRIPTPHLDALARQGMRFTDAHASSSLCTPSRYGLLTGRYAWRGRLQQGVSFGCSLPLLEPGRMTLASLLHDRGYRTACIGKWHLGLGWATLIDRPAVVRHAEGYEDLLPEQIDYRGRLWAGPHTAGFDEFFGIPASLDMPPYCFLENDRVLEAPVDSIGDSPWDAYWRAGPIAPGFRHGEVLPRLLDRALGFIRGREGVAEPFFLYFPLTAPHTPVLPSEAYRGRSGAGDYGDFVAMCDGLVGAVVQALEETGQASDTLFIFTSDNGCERNAYERARVTGHFSMGDLRGIKRDLWEGGHRVPFVARWPARTPAGSRCDDPVCLTDVLATVAELTGATLPRDAGEDSISLLPLLQGRSRGPAGRDAVIHHSANAKFAIRKDGWVFIDAPSGDDNGAEGEPDWFKLQRGYVPHGHPVELFDISSDPSERVNRCGDEPERVQALKAMLDLARRAGRTAP